MKRKAVFLTFCAVCVLMTAGSTPFCSEDKIFGESGISRSFSGAYVKTMRFSEELKLYAGKHKVDLNLVLAIAMAESSGDDGEFFKEEKPMVSYAGAVGLMQVLPETKKCLEKKDRKKYTYMEAGVRYLRALTDQYKELAKSTKEFPDDESELKSFVVQAYNGGAAKAQKGEVKNQSMLFLQRVSLYAFLLFQYGEELEKLNRKNKVVILEEPYTWQKLAEKLGIGMIELRLYNPLIAFYEPETVSKGRAIAFPEGKDSLLLEVRLNPEGNPKEIYYIVRLGDTFHDLANSFFRKTGDSDSAAHFKELRNKNNLLKWGPVQVGMRLNVAGSPYLNITTTKNQNDLAQDEKRKIKEERGEEK